MLESCNVSRYSTEGYPDIIFRSCIKVGCKAHSLLEKIIQNPIRPVLVFFFSSTVRFCSDQFVIIDSIGMENKVIN